MRRRSSVGAVVIAATLLTTVCSAQAFDETKYPDLTGHWERFVVRGLGGQPSFDQTKPWGLGQQAPLTAEYQKVMEASLADQANGGEGNFLGPAPCLPPLMPPLTIAVPPLEFVVPPDTTLLFF